jgi:hypothetical protein
LEGPVTRDDQQRIVFDLCQHRRFEILSEQLVQAYHRGLEGMAAHFAKTSVEYAAWKAGRLIFAHSRSSRR